MSCLDTLPPLHSQTKLMIQASRKPSKETLGSIKVELKLKNPKSIYHPNDLIEGDLLIYQTNPKTIIKDVYFNDIVIKFENKTINSLLGKSITNFIMFDNPTIDQFPLFTMDPDKEQFQNCQFPFKFKLPMEFLETNVCKSSFHNNLSPSFGCPSLAKVAFGSTSVAGINKDFANDESFQILQNVQHNGFLNYYTITAVISQNISKQKPFVLFNRSLEIKVQNDSLLQIPSNLMDHSPIDIAWYYDSQSFNSNYDLFFAKTINIKSGHHDKVGNLTVSSLKPSLLTEHNSTSFKVDFRYYLTDLTQTSLPNIKINLNLSQFLIQSKKCLKPMGNPIPLPKTSSLTRVDNGEVLIENLRTVYESNDVVLDGGNWIPDYDDENSYLNQHEIVIPNLERDVLFQKTFHSCHLQNIYNLELEINCEFEDEQLMLNDLKTQRKKSWSELIGFCKNDEVESIQRTQNKLVLNIPITVE